MKLQRTIDTAVIRACLTENKLYCFVHSVETAIYKAIDDVTAQHEALITDGVGLYRVEMDDGRIAGFVIIKLADTRETIAQFIRPSFMQYGQEFNDAVEAGKNTLQRLVVS